MSDFRKGFNNHFIEFIDDIATYFSDNVDIQTTATALRTARKANPNLIISVWFEYVVAKYDKEIMEGNLDFFISKDYNSDLSTVGNKNSILEGIDKIRKPIRDMSKEDQEKSMKYIQNLTKLCKLYYLNRN